MFVAETKTAIITNAVATGSTITYTGTNTFQAGDIIHISGISPYTLNIPDAIVTSSTGSSFVISSTSTGTYVSGGKAIYDELKNHTISTSVINVNSATIAEINLNTSGNISKIGNYRYRPTQEGSPFNTIASTWDEADIAGAYTGATDSDIAIDAGLNNDDTPYILIEKNDKMKKLFSLEDCFGRYRPRSGINKMMYMPGRNINYSNKDMANRPRYYAASPEDKFKYHTSYRKESNGNGTTQFGISKIDGSDFIIEDVAPFIVYNDSVPANRVIVKMQTHVGSVGQSSDDAFYGVSNKSTPLKWKIQGLNGNIWEDIWETTSDIVPVDGYVEIQYGLEIPSQFIDMFYYVGEYPSEDVLPVQSTNGNAYLVGANNTSAGIYYIWNDAKTGGAGYESFAATYGWSIANNELGRNTPFATKLVDPEFYVSDGERTYREFDFLDGLRIVVDTMNKKDATFDLIELSPRLAIDLSDKVDSFSITKSASDLGSSGLPVGQLISSIGKMGLFDYDQAFSSNMIFEETQSIIDGLDVYGTNGSIIYNFVPKNLQLKFYEITKNVGQHDYYIPIKTLYCDGFPETSSKNRTATLSLRDQFVQFESFIAPELFVPNVSLSVAISMILDSIGFSNYTFKRTDNIPDPIIPFFYVAPNKTVAEILQDLAVSTQHAMFFDEYNNFVVMSKEYFLPSVEDRDTDYVLYGSQDYTVSSNIKVKENSKKLSNILEVASQTSDIYNDGKITYSVKSIQKSISSLQESYGVDKARRYIYKPVLLWEAEAGENTKSINGENEQSSAFGLTAIPLNSDLSENIPSVINGLLIESVSETATETTYTTSAVHSILVGDKVTITECIPTVFNISYAQVISKTSNTFTVKKIETGQTYVSGGKCSSIRDDIIDLGEGAYWLPRYDGYFYANGEIIRYKGIEFTIQGLGSVWITNNAEYQDYFSRMRFGKKIFPTGRIKIYVKFNADGSIAKHGRGQFGTTITNHTAGLSQYWTNTANINAFEMESEYIFSAKTPPSTEIGAAGVGTNSAFARKTAKISGKQKNIVITNIPNEDVKAKPSSYASAQGNVQTSALIFKGPTVTQIKAEGIAVRDFITYIPKQLDSKFVHFGTRMRVIGNVGKDQSIVEQTIDGSTEYYTNGDGIKFNGGSGGIAIMLDHTSSKNTGYYFELAALSYSGDGSNVSDVVDRNNIFFYKVKKDSGSSKAIPISLWQGLNNIVVDDGEFVGQQRQMATEIETVYDLAVEYKVINKRWIRFFLYLNDTLLTIVDDKDPLPQKNRNNMAMFVRGSAKIMFENIYAIRNKISTDGEQEIDPPAQSVPFFYDNNLSADTALHKYALSGIIKDTVLSTTGKNVPKYSIYYDEFGTIFRECMYMDVKFDKAYPSLHSKVSPTMNLGKGYVVSEFTSNAYGAQFMIFNATDNVLNMDSSTGNYLRIQGVTFNQEANNVITVDSYYDQVSDFSSPDFQSSQNQTANAFESYIDIKNSRFAYGTKEFNLNGTYIQDNDTAKDLMGWILSKTSKPKKSVGIRVFGVPYMQLGDVVTINYVDNDGVNQVSLENSRYVVYSIDYSYSIGGPETIVYLSEVV